MWAELKTLLWLQYKLTASMFRSRRTRDMLRILQLLLQASKLLLSLPMFVLMGIALAVTLALLSPGAAYEVAMVVNSFVFFVWLVLPVSYNSQLVERFEMSQLFAHPIRFRSIVISLEKVNHVKGLLIICQADSVPHCTTTHKYL